MKRDSFIPSPVREQLDLFPVPPAAPRMTLVERIHHVAFSDLVKAEVLSIVQSRVGEWLSWRDFRSVIDRHSIGSCFGHLLHHLSRAGLLLEQECYFGSRYPWEGNYQGYSTRWAALGTEGPLVLTEVCNGG
ncbi:hypothetical protein GTP46_24340 [Duganella sp. FT135W]|uniref:Uncharacterized protein n=1 Tax=Duganella flavida TaxID=2692175 RepID=A0A6L8KJ47_9BURK|nr:hypothetical protein [Duganella flavida]MYM25762.1 hypothetical protein [Duganella flavida]